MFVRSVVIVEKEKTINQRSIFYSMIINLVLF